DGKRVVIVGGTNIPTTPNAIKIVGAVRSWDRHGSRVDRTLVEGESGEFTAGLFSADGRRFFLGNVGSTQRSGKVKVGDDFARACWHGRKAQCWGTSGAGGSFEDVLWSADGEQDRISAMVLDPTGTRLVLADDGGVWVFDAATGQRRGGLIRNKDR